MSLMPAEWVRRCPDCGRRLTLPTERHVECEEVRRWTALSWTACNACGFLNGRHDNNCPTRRSEGDNR